MLYKIITIICLFCLGLVLSVFSSCTPAHAAHLHKEREYQECWCAQAGGVIEYVLPDKTRVDCLPEEYAIEFDFAENWAESIGQAVYSQIGTIFSIDKQSLSLLMLTFLL